MKNIYLFIGVIFALSANSQENKEFESMVEAEMKSASRAINLVVNPNTLNYDITYHKLEFTVDPAVASISGKVTTTYTATANMSTLTFDLFDSLAVSSVKMNGVDLVYTQFGTNELVISLPAMQMTGTSAIVEIVYAGDPPLAQGFESFKIEQHNGVPVMWTLSEPYGARDWWPCKQDLNDKVDSIDVYITAPSQYVSVANGVEPEAPIVNGALKTTHFRHQYPIPAYLIAFAVTDYQVYNQQGGLGTPASPFFPIVNYMYPETAAANIASLAPTLSIINFYETKFGAYPFRNEKYGHCQFGWGGGMEHTTVSFMTANSQGRYSRSLIAHEMAHQWFGDKVTCGSWKDIWLNEGFATYLASMVIEQFDGETAFTNDKNNMINSITNSTNGAIYLTDDEALSVNRIFSYRLSYLKGAMVINMLRFKLGDTNFFQGLQNYLNDPLLAYGYAKTPNLQAHLEASSGLNLTEFFNDWVYNQGYPIYNIEAHNIGIGQARITINQSQSDPSVSFFEMPIPIRLFGSGGLQQDFILDNTTNGQQFIVNVPFTVTSVTFDPKKDIISRNGSAVLAATSFDLSSSVVLYPNPANSEITIETPNLYTLQNIIIYNALGQKVGEYSSNKIPVSQFSIGMYSVKIITSEGAILKKFIKK